MEPVNKFKKGDYIVLLKGFEDECFILNCVYEQDQSVSHLSVYKDYEGDSNSSPEHPFDKSENNDWRYATKEEIDEYNYLTKPYNILIHQKKTYKDWSLVSEEDKKIFIKKVIGSLYVDKTTYERMEQLVERSNGKPI